LLTKDTVQHIAKLSRLKLTDDEAAAFSTQLSAILDSFNEISTIDTQGIEPMVTPSDLVSHLRVDRVEKNGMPAELLENAPEKSGNLFKVPPVV
jgi:aspartyl-tRNA(Asn)/glutamyl-tRNA(Gln) amidotransferase subunit C